MFKPEKSKLLLFVFIALSFIVGWFFVVAPYSQFVELSSKVDSFINNDLVNSFPEDLAITIKDSQVAINQPSPYCLTFPGQKEGVVFDTDISSPQPSDLKVGSQYSKLCEVVAVVGREYVIYPDRDYGYRITQVPAEVNLVIDRAKVASFVNEVKPVLLSFGRNVYFALPFVIFPFVYVYLLLLNFWYTSVVKLIGQKILKIKPSESSVSVYNQVLFFHTIVLAFDVVVLQYLLKTVLGYNEINTSFFLRNTIIISAITLYYQSSPVKKSKV